MKKWLCLFLAGAALHAGAQQLNTSSFFDLHGVLHNPATAGSGGGGSIGGSFRTQWSGMPGGPQTGLIYGQGYLEKHRLGLGGYLYSDVTGPTRRTGLQMAYAYHVPVAEDATFSVGLEGRVQHFSYDREKILQSIGAIDPVLAGTNNRYKGDAGLGLAYSGPRLQAGLSVSQLVQSKLNLYEGTGNEAVRSRLYRHFYLHGNYRYTIDEANELIPHLLLIYLPNAPAEVQGGFRFEHKGLFWFGGGWRLHQSWMLSAGVHMAGRFHIGYSFDLYKTPLGNYDRGASGHELMLRYSFRP
ncbi:MAG TPA: PorP/SprF family type IX secretion system membrane protein [Chitinophagaceae bacterium]|jgi:type IX secretion system PorP/SprF family membrane protein|nr:PorP/SprF family type IX secretion system membrane protein [Chitinophagaceae bacterium]